MVVIINKAINHSWMPNVQLIKKVVVLPFYVSQTNRCFIVFHPSSLKYSRVVL